MGSGVTTYGVGTSPGRRLRRVAAAVLVLVAALLVAAHRYAGHTVDAPAVGGFAVNDAGQAELVTGARTVSSAERAWLAAGSVPTTAGPILCSPATPCSTSGC